MSLSIIVVVWILCLALVLCLALCSMKYLMLGGVILGFLMLGNDDSRMVFLMRVHTKFFVIVSIESWETLGHEMTRGIYVRA